MQTTDSRDALCVITSCFNDVAAFQNTLASFQYELTERDELIVVDSSSDRNAVLRLIEAAQLRCAVRAQWQAPRGVYAALNAGVAATEAPWIQIVNSGDGLLSGAREQISRALRRSPDVAIHVFRQQAGSDSTQAYVFTPDARGIWPHQSIVVARRVHEILGVYDNSLRLTADQVFFARARGRFTWQLHDFVLTRYDLHGMSSIVSLSACRELYGMWRVFGRGQIDSVFRAWVKPILRGLAQRILGPAQTHKIKRWLFSHYRHGDKL